MAIPWKLTVDKSVVGLEFYATTTGTLTMLSSVTNKTFEESIAANVHHVLIYGTGVQTFTGEFMHSTNTITAVTGVVGVDANAAAIADTNVTAAANFML